MSASYLFSQSANTIDPKFIPAGAIDPTLAQVLAEGNSSGANDMVLEQVLYLPSSASPDIVLNGANGIIDCTSLRVNAPGPTNVIELNSNGEITCDTLVANPTDQTDGVGSVVIRNGSLAVNPSFFFINNPSQSGVTASGNLTVIGAQGVNQRLVLELKPTGDYAMLGDGSVVGGAELEINGSLGASRVNDPIYNPAQRSVIYDLSGSQVAEQIPTGVSGPFSRTPTVDGLYRMEFGWELGTQDSIPTGGFGVQPGTTLSIYDSSLPSTSALSVQSYKNTSVTGIGGQNMDAPGFSISSNTFPLTAGTEYDFYFSVTGNPIYLSQTINPADLDGEWFFRLVLVA